MSEPSDLDLLLVPPPRTLEEHLRTLREHSRLIADFFRVHAQAIEGGARVELAADSCYAMSELCDRSANYLERLGKVIPAETPRPPQSCIGTPSRRLALGCHGS